jgi:hypothetical protein
VPADRGVPGKTRRCDLLAAKGLFEPNQPIEGLELIAAVQQVLGRESQACYRLLQWARIRAEGESFRGRYRELGRPRSTAYYRRNKNLRKIADALNCWACPSRGIVRKPSQLRLRARRWLLGPESGLPAREITFGGAATAGLPLQGIDVFRMERSGRACTGNGGATSSRAGDFDARERFSYWYYPARVEGCGEPLTPRGF